MSYKIRKAETDDLPRIRKIYGIARKFMREHGNSVQWEAGDAPELLLEEDIKQGHLYVLEENGIHAVFAFIIGEDPTYRVIDQGNWLSEERYGAVHRVAGDGTVRNVLKTVMDYCKEQIPHLRIDTHEMNKIMQHVIEKSGFTRQGIIYVGDGSSRIAYEWIKK